MLDYVPLVIHTCNKLLIQTCSLVMHVFLSFLGWELANTIMNQTMETEKTNPPTVSIVV